MVSKLLFFWVDYSLKGMNTYIYFAPVDFISEFAMNEDTRDVNFQ